MAELENLFVVAFCLKYNTIQYNLPHHPHVGVLVHCSHLAGSSARCHHNDWELLLLTLQHLLFHPVGHGTVTATLDILYTPSIRWVVLYSEAI